MPRSVLRLPPPGAPDGGSAPGQDGVGSRKSGVGRPPLRRPTSPAATVLRLRGRVRGRAVSAIPWKRVPASWGAVYPPRGARSVQRVARDAVALESLPCDTRDTCDCGGIGSSHLRRTATNGGEAWPMTWPASRRRDRSPWCGSSTAPLEGIFPEPPVWRRICCTTTRNNSGR
jgi:hypothetical protein